MTDPKNTLILWGTDASPYVRKVKVALLEKNLAFEQHQTLPVGLLKITEQAIPDGLVEASPLGKIPALEDNAVKVADSAVIMAYLDRQYTTGTTLYPSRPSVYACARWFENYADTIFSSVAYMKIFMENFVKPNVLQQASDTAIVEKAESEELPPMLDYLNQTLTKADYLAGDDFSAADIATVTHFISMKQADFQLDAKRWPALDSYVQRVLARPAFQQVL